MFVLANPYQNDPTFASKVGQLKTTFKISKSVLSGTQRVSEIMYLTFAKLARNKRSSLFVLGVSEGGKRFTTLPPNLIDHDEVHV